MSGRDQLREVHLHRLVARVAEDLFASGVERGQIALEIERVHEVVRILEQLAITLFTSSQVFLCHRGRA